MTIDQQRVLSNRSMMCVPPYEYMVPAYEYEECAENSSDTGDTEEENPQNMERAAGGTHDAGIQPSDTTEPAGLGGMQGWHCRATLRWTSCTCPWSGK